MPNDEFLFFQKSAFILSWLRVWVQLKPKFFLSAVDKLDDDGRFLAGDLVNWLDQLFIIWYDHCNILQQALLLIDCLPKTSDLNFGVPLVFDLCFETVFQLRWNSFRLSLSVSIKSVFSLYSSSLSLLPTLF